MLWNDSDDPSLIISTSQARNFASRGHKIPLTLQYSSRWRQGKSCCENAVEPFAGRTQDETLVRPKATGASAIPPQLGVNLPHVQLSRTTSLTHLPKNASIFIPVYALPRLHLLRAQFPGLILPAHIMRDRVFVDILPGEHSVAFQSHVLTITFANKPARPACLV